MFTSLFAAKRSGVIAFDWLDTCVIVHGTDAFGRLHVYGMESRDPLMSDLGKSIWEMSIARELGIVRQPAAWAPEEFNS